MSDGQPTHNRITDPTYNDRESGPAHGRPLRSYQGGYRTNNAGNYYHDRGPGHQVGNYAHQQPGGYRGEPVPQYQGQNRYEPDPRSRYLNQPPQQGFQRTQEEDPNASLAVDLLRLLLRPGVLRT